MATAESLTAAIDRVIELFNAKAMDLPDGFFDRRTQFVLNGSSFEILLGRPDNDLRLAAPGHVEVAEVTVDPAALGLIRVARLA